MDVVDSCDYLVIATIQSDMSEANPRGKWRRNLEFIATILMIAASLAILWFVFFHAAPSRRPQPPRSKALPNEPLDLAGLWLQGRPNAKVMLLAHIDFECPSCARFAARLLPTLLSKYVETGNVQFAVRHFPIIDIHPNALTAAAAAECAGRQGQFWAMHDRLLKDQKFDTAYLLDSAALLNLDAARFSSCLGDKAVRSRVLSHAAAARSLGVTATPTFFVGLVQGDGRLRVIDRFDGIGRLQRFESTLEAALRISATGN